MDILTFFAHLISAIAWPCTVLVCALVFKKPIESLFLKLIELTNLIDLKFGKVQVKLQGAPEYLRNARRWLPPPQVEIQEPKEVVLNLPTKGRPKPTVTSERPITLPMEESLRKETGTMPEAALDPEVQFDVGWTQLGREAVVRAKQAGGKRIRKVDTAIEYLAEKDLLTQDFLDTFDRVYSVHKHSSSPLDPMLALEFSKTCERLVEYLRQIYVPSR
jgi:hypothetical protein